MRNSVLWPLLASTAVPLLPALAETSDEPLPAAVQERLDTLERKVRLLERRLEVNQETKLADKAKQTATVSAGADGFALKSNNGVFQLKLRGLLQADGRFFFDGENTPVAIPNNGNDDTFPLRRVRRIVGANSFADPTTAAEEAAAWAVGLNWYLNNNVKFVLDYEQTDFEGGGGGTTASPLDRDDEKVLLSRIQLYF